MKKITSAILIITCTLGGCDSKEQNAKRPGAEAPVVSENGNKITFPDEQMAEFFTTEQAESSPLESAFSAPAKVAATVVVSREGAGQNIVLFEDPELASNYTELLTHQQKIKQLQGIIAQKHAVIAKKKSEVARFEDLFKNGAGTGKDVADAQVDLLGAQTEATIAENELAAERTAIIEHETKLKTAGFEPGALRQSRPGKAFIICEVAESQIANIKEGQSCNLHFNAFPEQNFKGKIEDVADLIDQSSQMVKVRITLDNTVGRLKAGMFATVGMAIGQGNQISVAKTAVVTVQGKSYVFLKDEGARFFRKQVSVGSEVGDRFVVFSGIKPGDKVVTRGVLQLKGLSFGY